MKSIKPAKPLRINTTELIFTEFAQSVARLDRPMAQCALGRARERLGGAVISGEIDARDMQKALDLIEKVDAAIENTPRA